MVGHRIGKVSKLLLLLFDFRFCSAQPNSNHSEYEYCLLTVDTIENERSNHLRRWYIYGILTNRIRNDENIWKMEGNMINFN